MAVVKFSKQTIEPNPLEVDYWVDITSDPYGSVWKYYNGIDWVSLNLNDGSDNGLSSFDYYTKEQVNSLLSGKADADSVESKVDDAEFANVIQNIEFREIGDNQMEMVLLKYDNATVGVTIPMASETNPGMLSGESFRDFVKQSQLQQLYNDLYQIVSQIIPNTPDEEDITAEGNLLKLKNRDNVDGMGYVILRKNKSFKEQLTQTNTIYEVRYEFDLNGETVTIPDNCVLNFTGGVLTNGEIGQCEIIGKGLLKVKTDKIYDITEYVSNYDQSVYKVKSNSDLSEAIKEIKQNGQNAIIVVEKNIKTTGINIESNHNVQICSRNDSHITYSKYVINKTNALNYDANHWTYQIESVNAYDIVNKTGNGGRLLWSNENNTYYTIESPQEWNIVNDVAASAGTSYTDDDVYVRIKLDKSLVDLIDGIGYEDEKKASNVLFGYTTGYKNHITKIKFIKDGYVYYKPSTKNGGFSYDVAGDNSYNVPMRYKLFNIRPLDKRSVYVDENNILHVPINIDDICYIDKDSTLIEHSGSGKLEVFDISFENAYCAIKSDNLSLNNVNVNNVYYAVHTNEGESLQMKDCKISNIYHHGVLFNRNTTGGQVEICNCELTNIGLIKYDSYAISVSVSKCDIYNNLINNCYTAILVGDTREYSNREICAAVYNNKITIEDGFIDNTNKITDFGCIYIFTHQFGSSSLGYGTHVTNNVLINKNSHIICNGIYLDDGAYNVTVEGNYVYGFNMGLTSRYVSNIENSNKNNVFKNNIIVEGGINIGQQSDISDENTIVVEKNFICNKNYDQYDYITTNLNAELQDNILYVHFFYANGEYGIIVADNIYDYLIEHCPSLIGLVGKLESGAYLHRHFDEVLFSANFTSGKSNVWSVNIPAFFPQDVARTYEYDIDFAEPYLDFGLKMIVVAGNDIENSSIHYYITRNSPSVASLYCEKEVVNNCYNLLVGLTSAITNTNVVVGAQRTFAKVTMRTYSYRKINSLLGCSTIRAMKINIEPTEKTIPYGFINSNTYLNDIIFRGADKQKILISSFSDSNYGDSYSPFLLPLFTEAAVSKGTPSRNNISVFYQELGKGIVKNVNGKLYSLDGKVYYETSGDERPQLDNTSKGYIFFDTVLNKPIWWTGSAWVDATGTDV